MVGMPPQTPWPSGHLDDEHAVDEMPDEPKLAFESLYKTLEDTVPGRVLFISRHGESMYNLDNRIGGNPELSPRGRKYARALGNYVNNFALPDLKLWTSELFRTHQTGEHIDAPRLAFPELNELDSGTFDDLTYEEFEERYPEKFKEREQDKLNFRYPGGESYVDVCRRLEPILPIMDRENHLLVISHQAVIRCILAFLLRLPAEEVPYIKVPLHCILKVTFMDGKNFIEYHHMPIECVDTYRPKVDVVEKNNKTEGAKRKEESTKEEDLLFFDACESLTP